MPKLITVTTLTAQIRQRAEMKNSQYATDADLRDMIARSVARLYDVVLKSRGADYYRVVADFSTSVGQELYTLPGNFYQLRRVLVNEGDVEGDARTPPDGAGGGFFFSNANSGWLAIEPFNIEEYEDLINDHGSSCRAETRYSLTGQQHSTTDANAKAQIELRPVPRSVFTVRLVYTPTAVIPTDTDYSALDVTFDSINGWTEWVVADVVAKLRASQQEDTSEYLREKAEIEAGIRPLAGSRDQSRPERQQDARGIVRGGRGTYRKGRWPWGL
jgi:hypothetical protein